MVKEAPGPEGGAAIPTPSRKFDAPIGAGSVETAVAAGVSPWRAHAERNRRDSDHPFLVGFYRIGDTIKPLYGDRTYMSYEGPCRVNLIKPQEREQSESSRVDVQRGPGWEALPDNFRAQMEAGRVKKTLFLFPDRELHEDRPLQELILMHVWRCLVLKLLLLTHSLPDRLL